MLSVQKRPNIGEASHPGPRPSTVFRDPQQLLGVKLVDAGTQRIQERVWQAFDEWLSSSLSPTARQEVFLCPALAAQLLRSYGVLLFQQGKPLYELRHLYWFLFNRSSRYLEAS